ncbi:MAG: hydrogenase maturation nickel metallochaperone HypA [Candidatus Aenigmarchaeota archaeon]|nr:hydrogenase maturation nickel metallochaperone HypA [Candidatus Aenigmarchaeota archaeon]
MHEYAIANDIIQTAKKNAGDKNKIKAIVVEVGDLGHLPAEELEHALKGLVKWDIKILKKPGLVRCDCGYEGEPKILEKAHSYTRFNCPKCGKELSENNIIDGDKIILKEVIID